MRFTSYIPDDEEQGDEGHSSQKNSTELTSSAVAPLGEEKDSDTPTGYPPWYRRTWLWGILVGVFLTGLVVGGVIGISINSQPTTHQAIQDLTPGTHVTADTILLPAIPLSKLTPSTVATPTTTPNSAINAEDRGIRIPGLSPTTALPQEDIGQATPVSFQFRNRADAKPTVSGYPSWGWCVFDDLNIVCTEGWTVLPDDGWFRGSFPPAEGNWLYGVWLSISAVKQATTPSFDPSLIAAYTSAGIRLKRITHGYQERWCSNPSPAMPSECMLLFEGPSNLDELQLQVPLTLLDQRAFRLPLSLSSPFWLLE